METFRDKNDDNPTHFFRCELCDYVTRHKGHYAEHILTRKHKNATKGDKMRQKSDNFRQDDSMEYVCECGKNYQCRQSLWRHKKSCNICKPKEDVFMKLIEQNSDLMKEHTLNLKEIVMEIVKTGTHHITNNTNNTNSHNKAFNLNFFLNETCKNAMNITDFVDSIKLQLSDFMEVGELGYVQGISNIIIKNLNSLDETVRPIHCTDKKRETIYIKDENKWEKEDDDMKKLRKMIKRVAYKNERLMNVYKERYPDYNNPESKRSDQYSKTVIEALGGIGENDEEKE